MSFVKYRLKEVAADFGVAPKEIAQIVEATSKIKGMTPEKVEEMVKEVKASKPSAKKSGKSIPTEYEPLKKQLAAFFQTDVQLTCNPKGKGKIAITFNNEEELERIITLLDRLKS